MNPDIEYDWAAHDARIREHYDHARKKHPYFCDMIESPAPTNRDKKVQNDQLEWTRLIIKTDAQRGSLRFGDLLNAKCGKRTKHSITATSRRPSRSCTTARPSYSAQSTCWRGGRRSASRRKQNEEKEARSPRVPDLCSWSLHANVRRKQPAQVGQAVLPQEKARQAGCGA